MKVNKYTLPRSIKQLFMMAIDGVLILCALWLSVVLVSPQFFEQHTASYYLLYFALCAFISVAIFNNAGLYRSLVLYMGLQSGLVILKGVTLSTVVISLAVYATDNFSFPSQALLVFWMMAVLLIGGLRFMAKIVMQNMIQSFRPREPVIIYGAGSSGMQLVAALNNGDQYLPVAFVDDSESLVGNTVHGIRVHNPAAIRELIETYSVRQILLAIPSATHAERKQILNCLEHYPVHVRTVPNLQIAAPKDALELRAMLKKALEVGGPVAIRYPRDNVERAPEGVWPEIPWGKWEVLKEGREVYLLAFGKTLRYALEAAGEDPRVGVVNARFLKPLDREMLAWLAGYKLITVEDHQGMGGFGSAVLEALNEMGLKPEVRVLALPDRFFEHGAIPSLHRQAGIDAEGIRKALREMGVAPVHERA